MFDFISKRHKIYLNFADLLPIFSTGLESVDSDILI